MSSGTEWNIHHPLFMSLQYFLDWHIYNTIHVLCTLYYVSRRMHFKSIFQKNAYIIRIIYNIHHSWSQIQPSRVLLQKQPSLAARPVELLAGASWSTGPHSNASGLRSSSHGKVIMLKTYKTCYVEVLMEDMKFEDVEVLLRGAGAIALIPTQFWTPRHRHPSPPQSHCPARFAN